MWRKTILILALISVLMPTALSTINNSASASPIANNSVNNESIEPTVVFFYSPTCPHCKEVEKHLQTQDRSNFNLKKYEASQNTQKFREYISNHSVPSRYAGSVPTVFIGEKSAVGSKNSIDLINKALEEDSTTDNSSKQETNNFDDSSENEKTLSGLGLAGLMGLAITDSINPCALAVLLILVGSIMSNNLKDQIRAFKSGASFTAGIFAAYFSMGILLVFGIKSVQKATSISFESVYLFFGGFAILIGVLNLKDWISHGLGGFAMEVPFSWRPKMKSYLEKVTGPAGAFLTALIVSMFLLPCTSGPYFVAGGILSNMAWVKALPLLAVYNLIFIAPMLLILVGLYYGATEVENVKEWRESNIEILHLIAGVILILLGLFLVLQSVPVPGM